VLNRLRTCVGQLAVAQSAAPPTWSSAVLPTRPPNPCTGPQALRRRGQGGAAGGAGGGAHARGLVPCCPSGRWTLHRSVSLAPTSGREALLAALAAGRTLVVDRYALSGAAFTAAKRLPGLDLAWCQARARPRCAARRLPCFTPIMYYHALPSRLLVPCLTGEVQVMGGRPGGPRAVLASLRVRRAQQLCIVFKCKRGCGGRICACAAGGWPAPGHPGCRR